MNHNYKSNPVDKLSPSKVDAAA